MVEDIDKFLMDLNEMEKEELLNRLAHNSGQEEFQKLVDILHTNVWPKAVLDIWICDPKSKDDKMDRAKDVLKFLTPTCQDGKKFLDFGCGEGHIAMVTNAELAVGYDIVKPEECDFEWEEICEHKLLTTDLEKVRQHAPYDIVLLFDVLDHADDPVEVLKTVKSLVRKGGIIFGHCHPWCGRHGGHLYHDLNKAFVHIIFDDKELVQLGCQPYMGQRVIQPYRTYQGWLSEAGFEDVEFYVDFNEPEKFFCNHPEIRKRINNALEVEGWPRYRLRQTGIDFAIRSC